MTAHVDPAYLEVLTGIENEPLPERQVGYEPVPRFDHFHVRFTGASPGFFPSGDSYLRVTAEILNGPQGTVGRIVSDDVRFTPGDITFERDPDTKELTQRPMTSEERATAVGEVRKTLRYIAGALGFTQIAPASLTEADIARYGVQFVGKEAILALRIKQARGNRDASNKFVFLSIAAPSGPAKSNGFPNALAEAQAKIEKANAKKKLGSAKTAGGLARPKVGGIA